jgi:predicted DNA-binding transcriptional regulator YafY
MPIDTGLSAGIRIRMMDSLLQHDRWWSREEIFREVRRQNEAVRGSSISDTTLRNDLAIVAREAGDHLLIERRVHNKLYYRYSDRSFSILNAKPLDSEDYDYLQQSITLLRQIKGFTISRELESIIAKLQYAFPSSFDHPAVVFDGPDEFEGMELVQDLYNAILKKQVIAFQYQPFTEERPQEFIMHPYLLKEYNNRWYLVGLSDGPKEIRVCGLDRFKSEPKVKARIKYIEPQEVSFHPHTWFADVIGPTVLHENPVEEVILKFNKERAPYITTKPIHRSQSLVEVHKDGSVSFSYKLRFNKEFESLLLSFGTHVTIIKPDSLKMRLKEKIKQMLDKYE